MSVNAGMYRHQLYFADGTTNEQISPSYWCSFKPLQSSQLFYMFQVFGQITAEVRLRYVKFGPPGQEREPKVSDKIVLDNDFTNKTYRIKQIINKDGRNEEFILIVYQ